MSWVFFFFSFFLGIKIVCKMGVVSKPYFFVCVLIDSDFFLKCFLNSLWFCFKPKDASFSFGTSSSPPCQALSHVLLLLLGNTHGKRTAGGLGIGLPPFWGIRWAAEYLSLDSCVHVLALGSLFWGSSKAGLVVDSLPWAWLWSPGYHHSLGLAAPRPPALRSRFAIWPQITCLLSWEASRTS